MRTEIIAQCIPRIIPVLDLKGGRAVHAVGGRRAHYQPVQSILHAGSDPLDLALAFHDLGLETLYVADLDAIEGAPPALRLYENLRARGISCWVDAGLRNARGLCSLIDAGVSTVVVGSETVDGPAALDQIVARLGPDRIVFSLDLNAGRTMLADSTQWEHPDPRAIAGTVVVRGIRRILVLDLARVGRGTGLGALPLVSELTSGRSIDVAIGGGIAGRDDLARAADAGATSVLVGTALHTGAIRLAAGALCDDR